MKRKLLCTLLIFMLVLGITGCGDSPDPVLEEGENPTDRVVVARPIDSDNLDPVVSVGNVNIWIYKLMLDSLLETTDDGKDIVTNLAESYTVSDDNLVYTFKLMPGIKFSDGTDVTVEDWVFTYERAMSDLASNWKFASDNIEKVEAQDDSTFVVTLKKVSPAMLANFSMFSLGVQSKAYYESLGATNEERDEKYVDGFVGTGPYLLSDWKKGEQLTLSRNPHYHKDGLPVTDEIVFKVVADDAARSMQLSAGEVDIITFVPFSTLKELSAKDGIKAVDIQGTETRFIALNTTNDYLSDLKVRKAINLATDNQMIVDMALYGYGEPARSFLQGSSPFLDTSIPQPKQDIEGAKALLKEAGYENGITINMLIHSGNSFEEQIATILKEQWAAIGVNLEIMPEEAGIYKEMLYGLGFNTVIDYWTDDVPDPVQYLDAVCDFDLYYTFDTAYEDPRLGELNKLQAAEMDSEKRHEYINEIQQIINEAQIFVPIAYVPYGVAMSDKISGFVQTPLGNYRFENLSKTAK